jgi:hypothetical protein
VSNELRGVTGAARRRGGAAERSKGVSSPSPDPPSGWKLEILLDLVEASIGVHGLPPCGTLDTST